MKNKYLVWFCDIHKSRSSMSLYGIYSRRDILDIHLNLSLEFGDIVQNSGSTLCKKKVNGLSIAEINDNYDYIFIEEIRLNERYYEKF